MTVTIHLKRFERKQFIHAFVQLLENISTIVVFDLHSYKEIETFHTHTIEKIEITT